MFLSKINKFITTNTAFFILITIIVFTLYGKSISFDFTYHDDDTLIINNVNYLSNIKNIPNLFLTSCYLSNNSFYYRPILNVSFATEIILFGLNTKIFHLTNIILFIFTIFLIYFFLSKLKLNKNILKFVCLIIAVHPVLTSCIVWIPGRNDTLLTIFICLSLINFVNYLDQNKIKFLLLHYLFFTIALFTKETTLLLIPMYIFFIYCFNYKITKQQIIKFLLILLPTIIIYFILRHIAVTQIDFKEYILNWNEYVTNILTGIMTYIDKLIFPDYIPIMLHNIKISTSTIILNISVLFLLIFLYFKKITNRKITLFAIVWFVLLLLPTFFQKEYIFLPHRLIIASIGIIIIFTLAIAELIKRHTLLKKYFIIGYLIFFTMFLYLSYTQMNKYKKADVYWTNAYVDASDYHLVINGLAKVYLSIGDYNQYKYLIYESYRLSSGDRYIFDIIGILLHEGNVTEAEKICLNILSDKNNKPFLKFGSLRTLGEIYFKKNDIKKAYLYTQEAYKLNPYDISISEKLGELNTILKNNKL
ncbi:MAG: glycosyltransferase family 39 protein [Endomicrobiia bacterium]|nr:glycosyltransferase family 39 protein [Endomicrobiaceae bacterium]MDD3053052.1 glycosyltransferase family 39 protein [Endomicrobiaceae bacterium]MDD3923257.1 glycosyltransferase family 39 protein [Endomicrobiaceae bacterium]